MRYPNVKKLIKQVLLGVAVLNSIWVLGLLCFYEGKRILKAYELRPQFKVGNCVIEQGFDSWDRHPRFIAEIGRHSYCSQVIFRENGGLILSACEGISFENQKDFETLPCPPRMKN